MGATIVQGRGLDELVRRLLEHHGIAASATTTRRLCEPTRPCRCPRSLALEDDWVRGWARCLLCGRDAP
jgi:hypothetical protein